MGSPRLFHTCCSSRTNRRQVSPAPSWSSSPSFVAFSSRFIPRGHDLRSFARIVEPSPVRPLQSFLTAARSSESDGAPSAREGRLTLHDSMGSPGGSCRAYKSSRSLVWRAMGRWQGLEGFSVACLYHPFTTAQASFSLPSARSKVAFSPARRARSTRSSPNNRLMRLVSLRPNLCVRVPAFFLAARSSTVAQVPGRIQAFSFHSRFGTFSIAPTSSANISSPSVRSPAAGGWTGRVSRSRT